MLLRHSHLGTGRRRRRLYHFQHPYAWWPTLAVLVVATVTDIRSRRIPNWLVFPFLLGGLVVSTWVAGWHGLGESLGGMALGGFTYGILAMMGGMGMGDVKLCAAIGASSSERRRYSQPVAVSPAHR